MKTYSVCKIKTSKSSETQTKDGAWYYENGLEIKQNVDAVPIVHGEWIKNDNGTYSCSVCQSWIPEEQHYYARYCLYCGAKMDGEVKSDG